MIYFSRMPVENENMRENRYDKIIRATFELPSSAFLSIFFPGDDIKTFPLPGTITQHIKEQEVDTLLKVQINGQEEFLFHLEYQSSNDPDIARRMASYDFMLHLKYKISIVGVVLYSGEKPMMMTDTVKFNNNFYQCQLIDLREIDANVFLESGRSREVIFAILASYGEEESVIIIQKILSKLRALLHGSPGELIDRMKELEILSNLRSKTIQKQLIEEEEKMTILYDLTTDIRFEQGMAVGEVRGEEKATIKFAEALIRKGFSISQIGETLDLSPTLLTILENTFPQKPMQ
jgi:hypothetical protein